MTDPKNPTNLPEFDLEAYEIATELDLPEPFEVAVEVAKRDNAEYIPLDEIDFDDD